MPADSRSLDVVGAMRQARLATQWHTAPTHGFCFRLTASFVPVFLSCNNNPPPPFLNSEYLVDILDHGLSPKPPLLAKIAPLSRHMRLVSIISTYVSKYVFEILALE